MSTTDQLFSSIDVIDHGGSWKHLQGVDLLHLPLPCGIPAVCSETKSLTWGGCSGGGVGGDIGLMNKIRTPVYLLQTRRRCTSTHPSNLDTLLISLVPSGTPCGVWSCQLLMDDAGLNDVHASSSSSLAGVSCNVCVIGRRNQGSHNTASRAMEACFTIMGSALL